MHPITIAALKEQTGEAPIRAAVAAQFQSRDTRATKAGKPYFELVFADATGNLSLKIWSDSPVYAVAAALAVGDIVCLESEWTKNKYGINPQDLSWHPLDAEDTANFLAGDPATREKQERDFADIISLCQTITDPRLNGLCLRFFNHAGDHFRRCAAAKKYHHARRGGLVEHIAQMMRSADSLCHAYHELNRDLLLTGVLFHDSGKLWENAYPHDGFVQFHDLQGELLGHIPLGIELVNMLWRQLLDTPEAAAWTDLKPSNEDTRIHLLHLVGSHHGQFEFGSPVLPRTPEAFALHHIDDLDAKIEMLRDAYSGHPNETGGFDYVKPLNTNPVQPLPTMISSGKVPF